MNDGVRLARIALHWLIEPGSEAVHRMVNANGPVRALERLVEGDVPDAKLRGAAAARMAAGDPREIAETALERAERLGARIVIPEDDEWPQPVRDLTKLLGRPADHRVDREVAPPLCMWVRGAPRLDETLARSVAVVGARAATHYGEHVATTLAYELAERDWTVVSGGAYGIDSAAHRGALNAGGLTVAVLACGIDRPYPAGNMGLFDRIADAGLLISEWPPGSDPVRHRFLQRLHECREGRRPAPGLPGLRTYASTWRSASRSRSLCDGAAGTGMDDLQQLKRNTKWNSSTNTEEMRTRSPPMTSRSSTSAPEPTLHGP